MLGLLGLIFTREAQYALDKAATENRKSDLQRLTNGWKESCLPNKTAAQLV